MPIFRKLHRTLIIALIVGLSLPLFARDPLPVDQGKTGLLLTLRKLRTTARLMHTAAHPDDEDGGMLTLESRGRGAYVVQMTLTRGEGGQNAVGKELGDELGMLRTLELLEADRYYGADQRFSRVADFGFSRSAEETIQKWNGRQTALADLVRVIRTLKPDVVISRFIGDSSDGHGNHQASGILTREAFRAAGDPTKFPGQIKEGLQPFQPKKLYVRARGDDWNMELDVNQNDPLLGMSYVAWGWQGLKHQLSQGSANWQMPTRMWTSHYKLVDTTIPNYKPGHEKDFFDGIDTTVLALAGIAPNIAVLKPGLLELTHYVDEASAVADKDPKAAAVPLLQGFAKTKELIAQAEKLSISPAERQQLVVALEAKRDQFRDAANYALGMRLKAEGNLASMRGVTDPSTRLWLAAYPSGRVVVNVSCVECPLELAQARFDLPPGSRVDSRTVATGGKKGGSQQTSYTYPLDIGETTPYTRQYWHRDDPDREAIYHIDDPQHQTLPLTPWPFVAHGTYEYQGLQGEIVSTVEVATPKPHPLIVGPAWSITTPNWTAVRSVGTTEWTSIPTHYRSNEPVTSDSPVPYFRLTVPSGWKTTPKDYGRLTTAGAIMDLNGLAFRPENSHEQHASVTAVAELGKRHFEVGYNVVSRDDLGTAYYFRKATQPVSIVDVKVPSNLRVGYIMGVGDDIPDVLRSIGVNVAIISSDELKSGDLSKYTTIVLGIRSYDSRPDLKANNQRLLEFAKNGGTLMVQYLYNTDAISGLTPYPFTISRNNSDRVVQEEAPVTILAPENPVFKSPNAISLKDFDGWVQERALYSPTSWDSHYQPLLESKDSDGPSIKGGLLVARYGKGTYIWNSWAFFRQLPAGVPGAIRLYVNLLNAGH